MPRRQRRQQQTTETGGGANATASDGRRTIDTELNGRNTVIARSAFTQSHRGAQRRNRGKTTSTQMRADTPADAGDADGCRLAFTLRRTGLVGMKNDLGRQSLPEVVHFFTFPARGGTDFQSHLRVSAPGARAARPASARICVAVGFPLLLFRPTKTTATARSTAGNQEEQLIDHGVARREHGGDAA